MKKIVAIVMVVLLAVMSGTPVLGINNIDSERISGYQLDYGDVPEFNKYLDNLKTDENLIGNRSTFNISLPILPFDQKDGRWITKEMKRLNLEIGSDGCALTCVAMIFKYYGTSTDPGKLNADIGIYACPLYWSKAAELGSNGVAELLVYDDTPTDNEVMNTCVSALEDGHPVIIGFQNPNDEEDTHFVLVNSLIGSGTSWQNYGVIDPNGGGTDNLYNILNDGYDFHRIVVYDKI